MLTKAAMAKEENRGANVQELVDLWKQDMKLAKLTSNTSGIKSTQEIVNELLNDKLITEDEKDIILGNETKGIEGEFKITIGSKTIDFYTEEYRDGTPGLYATKTNTLLKTWDELLEEGYITVSDNAITACQKNRKGDLVLPETINTIDKNAFNGYVGLTNIIMPETTKTIGEYAFNGCTGLTSIFIPDSVETIDGWAFRGTNIEEITLPSSLKKLWAAAFENCKNLKKVTIQSSNFTAWPGNSYRIFGGCTPGIHLIYDAGVTDIVGIYCYECTKVTIPNSTKTIGENAFNGCTGLTSIFIPDSVETIDGWAFRGTNIEEITLPSSLKKLWAAAFENCENLKKVTIQSSNFTAWSSNSYRIFTGCTPGIHFIYDEGVTNIVKIDCDQCTSIGIPSTVTSINSNAFSSYTNLTEINVNKEKDTISGSPWGASSSDIVHWKDSE